MINFIKNRKAFTNYGSKNSIGALMVTDLETYSSTTTGVGKSCRPFTDNWCSYTFSNSNYCICNIY